MSYRIPHEAWRELSRQQGDAQVTVGQLRSDVAHLQVLWLHARGEITEQQAIDAMGGRAEVFCEIRSEMLDAARACADLVDEPIARST